MENITVQQILEEYNLSFDELKQLLSSIGEDIEISEETHLPLNTVNRLKNYLSSTNKTSTYTQDNTSLYSDNDDTTQAYSDNPVNETGVYESSGLNKTTAYDSDMNNSSDESKTASHGISIGDTIILKDKSYSIIDIISEGTGEAIIYKVLDSRVENESNQIYALKLYFEFSNSKHEPNAETLERIKLIEHKDILKLVDFGVGFDKYRDKYCFEISEFAKGGDLLNIYNFKEKYTPSFIENNVIPEIFDGIKQLHSNKIYHCDLKPGNIFYLDEEQNDLIIGDYGSAKAYDIEETKEVIKTSTVKGSNFYLAPEQSRGLVSDKNDYYSFGMILLHLLYPEKFTVSNDFKKIDNRLFEKIVERGDSSMKLIDYNPEYSRINKLIEGLTLNVRKNRWGEKEVEKWIRNEDKELKVKYLSSENQKKASINLSGNKIIQTEEELIAFLLNSKNWKEELIEDATTKNELDNWLNVKYKKDKRVEINKILKSTEVNIDSAISKTVRESENIDYTKEAFIRYLRPEFPVAINEKVFKITDGDLNKNVNTLISTLDTVWQTLSIEKIRYILFQLEFTLKQLLKTTDGNASVIIQSILTKIYSSLGINSTDFTSIQSEVTKAIKQSDEETSQLKILNLFYTFNEQRGFKLGQVKCKTIQELGFYIASNDSTINTKKHFKVEKNTFLDKVTNSDFKDLRNKELVFEIFKEEAKSNIEYINLSFDKHRDYIIYYKFYKSLSEFLKKNQISIDYTSRSDNNEVFETKRDFFGKFSSVADEFLRKVKAKHNISGLTRSNEDNIRYRIVSDSRKQYIKVYRGQFIAAVCLSVIFVFLGFYHSKINYSPPIKKKTSKSTFQPAININRTAYIKADPVGNIRSGTSTNHKIITSLPKGEKIYVIEQDRKTNWYKVRYQNNKIGYVSNKIIDFNYIEPKINILKDDGQTAVINDPDGFTNVRTGKGTKYNVIKKLKDNERFIVYPTDEKWWKVKLDNGTIGYIFYDRVSLINTNNTNYSKVLYSNSFLGSWIIDNGKSRYKFYKNKEGYYINSRGKTIFFRWSYSDNYLKITLNTDNSVWNWKINSFSDKSISMYDSKNNIYRTLTKS